MGLVWDLCGTWLVGLVLWDLFCGTWLVGLVWDLTGGTWSVGLVWDLDVGTYVTTLARHKSDERINMRKQQRPIVCRQ